MEERTVNGFIYPRFGRCARLRGRTYIYSGGPHQKQLHFDKKNIDQKRKAFSEVQGSFFFSLFFLCVGYLKIGEREKRVQPYG